MTANQIIILLEAYKYGFTEKRDFNDWVTSYWTNTTRSLCTKGLLNRINKDVYEITEIGIRELQQEISNENILDELLSDRWKIRAIMNRWFR